MGQELINYEVYRNKRSDNSKSDIGEISEKNQINTDERNDTIWINPIFSKFPGLAHHLKGPILVAYLLLAGVLGGLARPSLDKYAPFIPQAAMMQIFEKPKDRVKSTYSRNDFVGTPEVQQTLSKVNNALEKYDDIAKILAILNQTKISGTPTPTAFEIGIRSFVGLQAEMEPLLTQQPNNRATGSFFDNPPVSGKNVKPIAQVGVYVTIPLIRK